MTKFWKQKYVDKFGEDKLAKLKTIAAFKNGLFVTHPLQDLKLTLKGNSNTYSGLEGFLIKRRRKNLYWDFENKINTINVDLL